MSSNKRSGMSTVRRLLGIALTWLALTSCANAAGWLPLAVGGGGGGGFTGIGDLSVPGTAVGYWGGDCYTKTGTYNIFQVYDTISTSVVATVECVSGAYAVTGGSTWTIGQVQANCLSTQCLAYYIYDQSQSGLCSISPACDVEPSASQTANAPFLVYTNGVNCNAANSGVFCFNFGASSFLSMFNGVTAISQPYNVACVASYNSGNQALMTTGGGAFSIQYNTSMFAYAGSAFVNAGTPSANVWEASFATFNSAGSPISQLNNNAAVTTNQGSNNIAGGDQITFGAWPSGMMGACFLTKTSTFGATAIAAMYSNWKGRWGGGMP